MENITNRAVLCGHIYEAPQFSHENHGRKFYKFPLEVRRLSGTIDTLPILAGEEILEQNDLWEGDFVRVQGQIRSFNNRSDVGRRLILSVYAESMVCTDEGPENDILLQGALCKTPILRQTPLGREICDVMLAVSRRYRRTDYVPCILWGRTAREAAGLSPGSVIQLHGRLQSRDYIKVLEDRTEERTAYEVSAMDAYILPES